MNPQSSNTPRILWFWSAKGGSGTSTVAAGVAVRLASRGRETVLVDLAGEQAALLGVITADNTDTPGVCDWATSNTDRGSLDGLVEELAPNLGLLRPGTRTVDDICDTPPESQPRHRLLDAFEALSSSNRTVVVDAGLDPHELRDTAPAVPVCVIRNCYLALRRSQRQTGPHDRIAVVEEPHRALRTRDVVAALAADKAATLVWDQSVARSVDAGTIVSQLPPPLSRGVDEVLALCGITAA